MVSVLTLLSGSPGKPRQYFFFFCSRVREVLTTFNFQNHPDPVGVKTYFHTKGTDLGYAAWPRSRP